MTADRWHQIDKIFHEVLEQKPADRDAYLRAACSEDPSVIEEVKALLSAHDASSRFLQSGQRGSFAGQNIGTYEIRTLLAAGGMGEVYRGWDTRLKRDVAVKVLPLEFSRNPDRIARFQREAEALAALNHPNIATIHDVASFGDSRFLILELIEGDTLADRLARGPIPIAEALTIAQQIADALAAAHEKGIIHRDLKPANIKVMPDGKVKVLDFGLAKISDSAATRSLSDSPTQHSASKAGMIVGTAAYMSPEQMRGSKADHRSDIFSFGSVLFEMLSGRPPFAGDTLSDVIAAVLKADPNWDLLPSRLHPRIREMLRRCLDKDLKLRWHAVADVRLELQSIVQNPEADYSSSTTSRWKAVGAVVAGVMVGAFVATVAMLNMRQTPQPIVIRFPLILPPDQSFVGIAGQLLALSPDGSKLAYIANNQLYLRHMSDGEGRLISAAGPKVSRPVFSPDNEWIAFLSSDGSLKKVSVAGGNVVLICKGGNVFGLSWDGDQIVFANPEGVHRVPPNGGNPELLIAPKADEALFAPQLLNDGRDVLFSSSTQGGPLAGSNVLVESLSTGNRRVLLRNAGNARYAPTGHIVYVVRGTVFGVALDVKKLEVVGKPVTLIDGVMRGPMGANTAANFAFSESGTLAFIPGDPDVSATIPPKILALVDRDGNSVSLPLEPGAYECPRFSPDGSRIVLGTNNGKETHLWIYEKTSPKTVRKLTFGGNEAVPVWSADGRYVIYGTVGSGMYRQLANGSSAPETLMPHDNGVIPVVQSVHPKENAVAFWKFRTGGIGGIWMLPLQTDGKPKVFAERTGTRYTHASISPDGRWVAYASDESAGNGRLQIHVRPYPTGEAMYQITTEGGWMPVWSNDDSKLFYAFGNEIFSVDIRTTPSLSFDKPSRVPLPASVILASGPNRNFDISPDGKQFIVVMPAPADNTSRPSEINLVLNWFNELEQRVPVQ